MKRQIALEWMAGIVLMAAIALTAWLALWTLGELGLNAGPGVYDADVISCSRTLDGFEC